MRKRRSRSGALVAVAAFATSLIGGAYVAFATMAAAADGGCQPGSGPDLAGQHITDTQLSGFQPGHLRCANLTGANLAGLSLIQADLTGAILRNADLQHTDMGQAVLVNADLSGANLTDADLTQVTAQHAKFVGANLTGAKLIQADLTGADLSKADLNGATFDEATLDNTNFAHATGVPPWQVYIGLAALLFFALLAIGSVRRGVRARIQSGRNPVPVLVLGLLGSLVVAIGFNLTVGGFIGEILSASGPPVSQTCSGLACTIGVSSGFIGIFGGVVVMIFGFMLRAGRRQASRAQPAWSGQF